MSDTDETKKVTEALYQHNLELAVKNKTLALLEKLYQTSILALSPEEIAQFITDAIRDDLNLEFAGIFNFKKGHDTLEPLAFSKSERLKEILKKIGLLFIDIKIPEIEKRPFLKKVIYEQSADVTDKLEDIWGGLIEDKNLKEIKDESNITNVMLYPLVNRDTVFQVLILGLNRDYKTLNDFEKSSISSFTNVITLSLNKAYLYKELHDVNEDLKNLIIQRESLMHLINHKVKGAFTHSKYIFAGILDGTFGEINEEIKNRATQGLESDDTGIKTIDLVLNATNLQKGTIKYEMKVLNLKDLTLDVISSKKIQLEAKGLQIETNIKEDVYNVNADPFWLKEAVNNLIENSIKYTKEGKIFVELEKDNAKVRLIVKDTGIGITDEDKKNLFTEGGRGKDSVKINTDSTGYGLYSVKLIVEAHKGLVSATSPGPDKGSTFIIELPIA